MGAEQSGIKGSNFSTKELKELKKAFKKVDKDKSGELDETEFRNLLKEAKILNVTNETEYSQLFKTFDADNSGTISFSEVATSLSVLSKGTAEDKLKYLFSVYDVDKSGTLEKEELEMIIDRMKATSIALGRPVDKSANFIDGIMSKLDTAKDGHITKKNWIDIGSRTPSLLLLLGINNDY